MERPALRPLDRPRHGAELCPPYSPRPVPVVRHVPTTRRPGAVPAPPTTPTLSHLPNGRRDSADVGSAPSCMATQKKVQLSEPDVIPSWLKPPWITHSDLSQNGYGLSYSYSYSYSFSLSLYFLLSLTLSLLLTLTLSLSLSLSLLDAEWRPRTRSRQRHHGFAVRITVITYTILTKLNEDCEKGDTSSWPNCICHKAMNKSH